MRCIDWQHTASCHYLHFLIMYCNTWLESEPGILSHAGLRSDINRPDLFLAGCAIKGDYIHESLFVKYDSITRVL